MCVTALDGAAAPCRRLAVYLELFGQHQTADLEICCSALFVELTACCPIMCVRVAVAVNSVCAGEQCMSETCMHDIVPPLGAVILQGRRRKVDDSAIDIAISTSRYCIIDIIIKNSLRLHELSECAKLP